MRTFRRFFFPAVAALVFVHPGVAAASGSGTPVNQSANPLTVAVLGDTPYGDAQRELFPALVG